MGSVISALVAGPLLAQPVTQIDISASFNADVIVRSSELAAAPTEDAVDAGDFAWATQSAAEDEGCGTPAGLPDNGFFAATGDHPAVQLDYSDGAAGDNAIRASPLTTISFPVPPANYETIHLFVTAGDGDVPVVVRLDYTSGSPDLAAAEEVIPDWFDDPSPPLYALIDDRDRLDMDPDYSCDNVDDPAIFGLPVAVDSARTLATVTISCGNEPEDDCSGDGVLTVYGAVGVGEGVAVVEIPAIGKAGALLLVLALAALGVAITRRRTA
jgi:hypothetical protein